VEELSVAARYVPQVTSPGDLEPEPVAGVATLAEAVERARQGLGEDLVFGRDVEDGVAGVSADAGPPERILQWLRTLAQMTRIRRAGKLGMNVLAWLKKQGLTASNETSLTVASAAEMRKRTGHDGADDRRFETPLKLVEATSPDRCVRSGGRPIGRSARGRARAQSDLGHCEQSSAWFWFSAATQRHTPAGSMSHTAVPPLEATPRTLPQLRCVPLRAEYSENHPASSSSGRPGRVRRVAALHATLPHGPETRVSGLTERSWTRDPVSHRSAESARS
jgi:hypothetical protein